MDVYIQIMVAEKSLEIARGEVRAEERAFECGGGNMYRLDSALQSMWMAEERLDYLFMPKSMQDYVDGINDKEVA